MVVQVILNETRNEIITVVVAWLHAQGQWVVSLSGRFDDTLRFELGVEEIVGLPLIDQNWQTLCRTTDQLASVPFTPHCLIVPQVSCERFDTPGHLCWIGDRCKG